MLVVPLNKYIRYEPPFVLIAVVLGAVICQNVCPLFPVVVAVTVYTFPEVVDVIVATAAEVYSTFVDAFAANCPKVLVPLAPVPPAIKLDKLALVLNVTLGVPAESFNIICFVDESNVIEFGIVI